MYNGDVQVHDSDGYGYGYKSMVATCYMAMLVGAYGDGCFFTLWNMHYSVAVELLAASELMCIIFAGSNKVK